MGDREAQLASLPCGPKVVTALRNTDPAPHRPEYLCTNSKRVLNITAQTGKSIRARRRAAVPTGAPHPLGGIVTPPRERVGHPSAAPSLTYVREAVRGRRQQWVARHQGESRSSGSRAPFSEHIVQSFVFFPFLGSYYLSEALPCRDGFAANPYA